MGKTTKAEDNASLTPAAGRVLDLRVRLGLSQEQLAQQLGVSFVTVNRWERGRVEPSPALGRRLQALVDADQEPAGSPPEPSLVIGTQPSPTPLLPRQRTSFLGRESELAQLERLWATTRLLTVTGPGGIGKTRLALELLRRTEGIVLAVVSLDSVPGELVPAVVAAELGLRPADVVGPADVARALPNGPTIVVLDTCEHVLDAVVDLAGQVLALAPEVRILITSQIVLGVGGEQVYRVPPLDPGPGGAAAAFFLARARERRPAITSDGSTGDVIAEICRRVDGIPLALELAAAWMSSMTPQALLERWKVRGELMVDRTAPHQRHQSGIELVEWSAALLSPSARQLVSEIATLVGVFNLDDAAAVSGRSGVSLLADIRSLVDSSWLEVIDETAAPAAGYRMLEALREWGGTELAGLGIGSKVRRRHAEHMLRIAVAAERDRYRIDLGNWPQRLELMSGNLRLAIDWALEQDAPLAGELIVSLLGWWRRSARLAEGRHWLVAVRTCGLDPAQADRAGCAQALLAMDVGRYDELQSLAETALPGLRRRKDHIWAARALTALSSAAKYRGDAVTARTQLEAAVEHLQVGGDELELAAALNNLGALTSEQGDLSAAEDYYRQSLRLKRGAGDHRAIALTLANLGDVYSRLGQLEEARDILAEGLGVAEANGDSFLATFLTINIGENVLLSGGNAEAVMHFRRARESAIALGVPRFQALAACGLGQSLLRDGDRDGALRALRESRDLAEGIGDEIVLQQVRTAFAEATGGSQEVRPPHGLSGREMQLVQHLLLGRQNIEIAAALGISTATVQRHLSNIYRKLSVRNRTEAAQAGYERGIRAPER